MSTREATRQQELEEQLSKLIGMMGQQQERQEQQQERQEAKLIGMMERQQERQEQLASEQRQWQEELAHQQEQQLEQLVEKQWKALEKRQLEAEQQVEAFQYDLEHAKNAMDGRFQTAEGMLAELQTSHQILAEEMRESQASLREEVQAKLEVIQSSEERPAGTMPSPSLLAELQTSHQILAEEMRESQASLREEVQARLEVIQSSEKRPAGTMPSPSLQAAAVEEMRGSQAPSREERRAKLEALQSSEKRLAGTMAAPSLRASAVEFIPSVNSFSAGADDGTHRASTGGGALQRPPPYDGRSSWEAYRAQFEMLAQMNNWTEAEKATLLAVSLRGAALTVLSNRARERRCDYGALVTALEKRFGTAHQAELNRRKLRTRNRRSEESLPELVEDIERLARLAYSEATPTMLEVLAKDQFIDSLAEEDIKLRLRQSRPESLRQALETALELESYQLASRQRSRAVREVQLEPDHDNGTSPQHREKATSTTVNTEVLEKLQQCIIDTMQRFTK